MFIDRLDGGQRLAERLYPKYSKDNVVVFGLPRGGVVTAKVVADRFRAPLDVLVTRKLGHPMNREYAIGAVAEGGEVVLTKAKSPRLIFAGSKQRRSTSSP